MLNTVMSAALTAFRVRMSPLSAINLNLFWGVACSFGVPAIAKSAALSCVVEIRSGRLTTYTLFRCRSCFAKLRWESAKNGTWPANQMLPSSVGVLTTGQQHVCVCVWQFNSHEYKYTAGKNIAPGMIQIGQIENNNSCKYTERVSFKMYNG